MAYISFILHLPRYLWSNFQYIEIYIYTISERTQVWTNDDLASIKAHMAALKTRAAQLESRYSQLSPKDWCQLKIRDLRVTLEDLKFIGDLE